MGYPSAVLAQLVLEHLATNPGASLRQTARACGVGRQTIGRALKTCLGQTFRGLRDECRRRALAALLTRRPPLLVKEIAFNLGFSTSRSLARWTKRIDGSAPGELRQALDRGEATTPGLASLWQNARGSSFLAARVTHRTPAS